MPYLSENCKILTPTGKNPEENEKIKGKWFVQDDYIYYPMGSMHSIEPGTSRVRKDRRAWLIDKGRLVFVNLIPDPWYYRFSGPTRLERTNLKRGHRIFGSYPFYVTDKGVPVWISSDETFSLYPVDLVEELKAVERFKRNARRPSRKKRNYHFTINEKSTGVFWRVYSGKRLFKGGKAMTYYGAQDQVQKWIAYFEEQDRVNRFRG